jgi:hypothetical protein
VDNVATMMIHKIGIPDWPLGTKADLFDGAGYLYDLDHGLFVNPATRKAFSSWFARDHSEQELEACIREPDSAPGEWRFYFNTPPCDSVRRQLEAALA